MMEKDAYTQRFSKLYYWAWLTYLSGEVSLKGDVCSSYRRSFYYILREKRIERIH